MKNLLLHISILSIIFLLINKGSLKAKTNEEKDLNCITLLKLASQKSKNDGEMLKYEKLKKLQKAIQEKYSEDHFSKTNVESKIDKHNLKIKEKGQRYINKGLQKCGLK